MAETSMLETILSGVLTGGATAGTAVLGFFRDTKKRIAAIEAKVGSHDEKSGLIFAVHMLEESLRGLEGSIRKLRADLDEWRDEPPEWAQALRRRASNLNLDQQVDFERTIGNRLRDHDEVLQEVEANVAKISRRIASLEDDLRTSDETRAREVAALREQLSAINGLLRGLQSVLDGPARR